MKENYNKCVEGSFIPSTPNELEILYRQLKREIELLIKNTNNQLLRHDEKIAELCKYIKDNLSNSLRCLINSMKLNRYPNLEYKSSMSWLLKI